MGDLIWIFEEEGEENLINEVEVALRRLFNKIICGTDWKGLIYENEELESRVLGEKKIFIKKIDEKTSIRRSENHPD